MTTMQPQLNRPNGGASGSKPAARNLSEERIEQIRARRKSRGELTDDGRLRLSVPSERKDPAWEYRWVSDREMRIKQMLSQDWEFAPAETTGGDERDTGIGERVERIVNDRTVTKAEKGFLMRKPKEFFEEDRKRRIKDGEAVEQGMRRGALNNDQAQVENGYIPRSGMRIDTGKVPDGTYKP